MPSMNQEEVSRNDWEGKKLSLGMPKFGSILLHFLATTPPIKRAIITKIISLMLIRYIAGLANTGCYAVVSERKKLQKAKDRNSRRILLKTLEANHS